MTVFPSMPCRVGSGFCASRLKYHALYTSVELSGSVDKWTIETQFSTSMQAFKHVPRRSCDAAEHGGVHGASELRSTPEAN